MYGVANRNFPVTVNFSYCALFLEIELEARVHVRTFERKMSHGANAVTRATQSAAKGRLSQAEVWDKVSAIQNGLSGFREQFDRLERALRTHATSTVMCPDDVDFAAILNDCENSSSLYNSVIDRLDNQTVQPQSALW